MSPVPLKKHQNNSRYLFVNDLPQFAVQVAGRIKPRDVISLTGAIGSGKTTFSFALLKALGLAKGHPFSSPTFTILNRYELKDWTVNHVDLYRLNRFADFEQLDIVSFFREPNALTLIEWGDKFSEFRPFYTKRIHFEYVQRKSLERMISFDGFDL